MREALNQDDLSKLTAAQIVTDWTDKASAGGSTGALLFFMRAVSEAHPGRHDEPEHEELTEAMYDAWTWVRDDTRTAHEDKVAARRYYRAVLGL